MAKGQKRSNREVKKPKKTAAERAKASGKPAQDDGKRPVLLNMCHIFDSNGEVVRKHWPAHYTGDEKEDDVREEAAE